MWSYGLYPCIVVHAINFLRHCILAHDTLLRVAVICKSNGYLVEQKKMENLEWH